MKKLLLTLLSLITITASVPVATYAATAEPSAQPYSSVTPVPRAEGGAEAPFVATVFNERNGLPTGEANCVLQTSDGYVWVGSYGGLIRYDGTTFRNFSTEGILPSSSVRMMYEDKSGKLWIGTNDAGVFYYENGGICRPQGQPSDSFLCVRGFAEGEDGVIYACSNSGAAEIESGVMKVYSDSAIAGSTVYSVGVDNFGRLWCANSSGGLTALVNGSVVHTFSGAEIFGEGGSVYSVACGNGGKIYVGSNAGTLAIISFTFNGFSPADYSIRTIETGEVSTHNAIQVMADGTVLICGQKGLGILKSNGDFNQLTVSQGAESVNGAFIDYEGSIWLASSNKGIVRFTAGCYSTPNIKAALEGLTVNAIAVSGGRNYLGMESELLIFDENWQQVENELTEIYRERQIRIRHILADGAGRVWLAAYNSNYPLVRYTPSTGEIKAFTRADGLTSDRARVIAELSGGRIAVGTQNGVSIIEGDAVVASYSSFGYPTVLCFLETEDSLLVGSDGGGIYEIKQGEVINHGFAEGLAEGVVLRMLKDGEGEGYFISAGSSLYYWQNGAFTKLTNLEKQPGSIFDFYQQGDTLWLLQNNGILAASRQDVLEGGTGKSSTYSFAHGLTGSLNANTWHSLVGGKLYLATRSGVSVFNFTEPAHVMPKIIINSVTVDGVVYERPQSIAIPAGAQRVTVDFAALSYTDTAPISIAYRLTGFEDAETVLVGKKSGSVSYTNLSGGDYSFELRAMLGGEEGQRLTLKLGKATRFTETAGFLALVIILSIGVAVAVVILLASIRIKTVKKRQQRYRDILEQALLTFAGTIDAKDKYTHGHSRRVAEYSRELAKRLGMPAEEQEHIYYVALLHDIGKIGIPDNILNKPGKLTPEERKIIETHPAIGAEILKNFTALEGISEGAKYHHERYDGKGYNEGIAGEEIPFLARIIGVADTYDAMSSERCYRSSLSKETIISELQNARGTQLDPKVVDVMLQMIEEGIVPFK